MVIVNRQANVLQPRVAIRPGSRFTNFLDSGEEQADQNCDDRNDDQQLDQGKPGPDLSH
jgi:hypothetical protein